MKNNYSLTPRTLPDSIKKELKSYQSIFYFDIFLMLALLVGLFYNFSGKDNTVADELLLYIVPTETVSSTIINLESNPQCATRDRNGYKHACYNVTIEATIDGKTINKVFKVVDNYKVGHFLNGERNPLIKYAKHNHSIIALANHHSSNFPICIGMLIFLAILICYVISLSKSKKSLNRCWVQGPLIRAKLTNVKDSTLNLTRKTNGITQQATYSYQVGNATYSLPITYKFRLNKPRDNKLEDLTPFTQSLSVSNFNIILLNVAKEGLNKFKRNPEKMPYLLFDEEIEIVYDPQKAYNAIPVFIADKQYSNH